MNVYEGYFSMHENQRDALSCDRLAMRLYLIHKDETNQTLSVDDMDTLFNVHRPNIERVISQKLDPNGNGYASSQDLIDTARS